jgi:hypothetical protein
MGTREYACSQRQPTAFLHHPQLSRPSTPTKSPISLPDSPEAAAEAVLSEGIREPSRAAGGHRTGRNLCERKYKMKNQKKNQKKKKKNLQNIKVN